MINDFKLPLVGLATCSYAFSRENPEAGIRQLRGGLKRLLSTELAMARCEFCKLKGYYETLDMTMLLNFDLALELCDGHSYKDLAGKLDLSASRIAKQVQTIFSKLGINRKDQLAKFVW